MQKVVSTSAKSRQTWKKNVRSQKKSHSEPDPFDPEPCEAEEDISIQADSSSVNVTPGDSVAAAKAMKDFNELTEIANSLLAAGYFDIYQVFHDNYHDLIFL